ncbi:MAG: hydrogenase maturation nickel metallochaperone HypA [Chromatiales bacterium]|nr:hydrogenase maturation nickel metallochaperone HypA [Chromatiales bacterium]
MHELALCQALLDEVERVARDHPGMQVERVQVRLGPLSGAEPDLLKQAYTVARTGTVAALAELEIEPVAIRVRCTACAAETDAASGRLVCGACGDWRTELVSGDELVLQRVELGAAQRQLH